MQKYINYIFTLRYIKLLSYWSAKYLQQSRQESHKHRYTYYYGFQIIYGAINKGLLLILLGLSLGILPQLLIATLSFSMVRVWAGGLHFDSYTKCAYVSLLSFSVVGLLSKYIHLNITTITLIFLFALFIFLMYAPIEHPNRPIKENERMKFKIIAISILIILFVVTLNINNFTISNSIPYGILLSGLIATPIFSKIK